MTLDTQKIPIPVLENLEATLTAKGYEAICGVDEVGRGPLAGPVVAAAVIIPKGITIVGLDDSKKLTPLQRDHLFDEIAELGIPCAIGIIDHETIDRINILKASLMAMRKAVMDIKVSPDFVIVDGSFTIPNLNFPQMAIIEGDASCQAIAAASIVAKVTRDRIMDRMEGLYPSYSFAKHKGYCTPLHLEELRTNGPCEIHRRSFRPVVECLKQYALL